MGRAGHYCQPLMGFHDHRNLRSVSGTENHTGFLENLQGSTFKTSFILKQWADSYLQRLWLPL